MALSRQSGLVASSLRSQHYLGRPSVGSRLTAFAAGRISSRHGCPAALSVRCQQAARCRLAHQLHWSVACRVGLRGLCGSGLPSTLRACTCSPAALRWFPVLRHLTTPSSGRHKGRCAPLRRRSCRTLGPGKRRNASCRCRSELRLSPGFRRLSERTPARSRTVVEAIELGRLSVSLAALPGPPVRWRSAYCQCSGCHLSSHGRPEAPSVGARNCMASSGVIGCTSQAACCQRRLKTDPLSILIAEVNLTHPGPLCCSGSAA